MVEKLIKAAAYMGGSERPAHRVRKHQRSPGVALPCWPQRLTFFQLALQVLAQSRCYWLREGDGPTGPKGLGRIEREGLVSEYAASIKCPTIMCYSPRFSQREINTAISGQGIITICQWGNTVIGHASGPTPDNSIAAFQTNAAGSIATPQPPE